MTYQTSTTVTPMKIGVHLKIPDFQDGSRFLTAMDGETLAMQEQLPVQRYDVRV